MSANILLKKTSVSVSEDYDFFSLPLSNHLYPTALSTSLLLAKDMSFKACSTGTCITKLGLSNACTWDQDGNKAEEVIFPFKIVFTPADVHTSHTKPPTQKEFFKQFSKIPLKSKLYTIKGYQSPEDQEGVNLGEMTLTGKCTTSYFGDTRLAFKHQRIEEDIALKPEWKNDLQINCICNGIDETVK